MRTWRTCARLCIGLALLAIMASPAAAERTLTHGLHAVPAPREVVIDGDLSDWDLSGAIVVGKDVKDLLGTESARVAAMWDADSLYLGLSWRDPTPMQNKVDPVTLFGNGWRSDCAQFRMDMDGFISHLAAWYYTTEKRPAMTIAYGRFNVKDGSQAKVNRPPYPERLGAQQAFKPAPDGKGYVQEIRIPWGALTADGKHPAPDADLRMVVELFWGGPDAQSWPKSRVADNLADGETRDQYLWNNPKMWGRLILDDRGHLNLPLPPWNVARAEPQGLVPIKFKLPRDGFVTIAVEDADGNRVASLVGGARLKAGENTVRWSGLTDRGDIVPEGTYRWRGLYRDALEVRWLMSFNEPNAACPWPNAQGTGAWGPDRGCLLAAAAGDGRVYLAGQGAESGSPVFAVDEAGKKLWSARSGEPDRLAYADGTLYGYTSAGDANYFGLVPRGLMQFDAKSGRWLDVPIPGGKPTKRLALLPETETVAGFAADAGGLYVSLKGKGLVRMFSRRTFVAHRDLKAPGAGEIFAIAGSKLLAATSQGIVELDIETGESVPVIEGDFGAATGLTADAKGKLIAVAFGAPRHQVVLFDREKTATPALVATLGKEGGRAPAGPYDPNEGFLNPRGLALDAAGKLWVVEEGFHPKRVSVWRRDGAKVAWVRDFIGGTAFGAGGVINPLDPTQAFYDDMQFKIDLGTGTWQLKAVGFERPDNAKELGLLPEADDSPAGVGLGAEYMTVYKGRAYLHIVRGARQIFREGKDGRWQLCVFIDPKRKLAWIDKNDDGQVQPDELVRGGAGDWGETDYWGMRPSAEMDLFFTRGMGTPGLRLRCKGVTKEGTPLYEFDSFEPMAGECCNGIGLADGSYNSGSSSGRGNYFDEMRRIWPEGVDRRTFWFRGEHTGSWASRMPEPGLVLCPRLPHGAVDVPQIKGEVVCWVSDYGQRYLFTDDMLYVDQLFADARSESEEWPDAPRRGFLANRMAPGQDALGGQFTHLKDGRYLLTAGATDCRVFEVTGLDTLKRFEGEVDIRPEDVERANEIREFHTSDGKVSKSITLPRTAAPLAIDSPLAEWGAAKSFLLPVDEARFARIHVAYDDMNLYVAWDVTTPRPLANRASRWELAFKGGDAVDLMFRTPSPTPGDPIIREGDLRVLITQWRGKITAVLYRPFSTTRKPFMFEGLDSAEKANGVPMDEVRVADEVKAAVETGKDRYVVKAEIPWSLLGGLPATDADGRIDFGVLFSDAKGVTATRAYWSNRDTLVVTDIPTEAELKPANWGKMRLAP